MCVNDIRTFDKNKEELESQREIVRILRQDIIMEFEIEKCAIL